MLTVEETNIFHDWVTHEIEIGNDFIIQLYIDDQSQTEHKAELKFGNIRELKMFHWITDERSKKLTQIITTDNNSFLANGSIDRWFQKCSSIEGVTKIELIGENEFLDSSIVLLSFKHDTLEISVDGKNFNQAGILVNYINSLHILK